LRRVFNGLQDDLVENAREWTNRCPEPDECIALGNNIVDGGTFIDYAPYLWA
jgi:hypothetical protein